jgi:hypothetical protein
MRLSLWSQFSSNHSARFTCVGVFDTPADAEDASAYLNYIFSYISEWYLRPENADWRELTGDGLPPPSPAELEVAAALGFDWGDYAADWIPFPEVGGPLTSFDRLVFIGEYKCDAGAQPADRLMEAIGGQALVDGSLGPEQNRDSSIWLYLTARAPDEASAELVRSLVVDFFADWSEEGVVYCKGVRLNLERWRLFDLASQLPELIGMLEKHACTDIEYMLTEERHPQ